MKNKRALSFLMALVLCLSLLPFGAFADEAETAEPEAEAIISEETSEESISIEESEETAEPEESSEPEETPEVEEITEAEEIADSEENAEPEAVIIEEDSEESAETVAEATEDGTIVASGSCGDSATYTLNSEGTLTISGTGDMFNFTDTGSIPWFENRGYIKTVVIVDGVTSIGAGAFAYCENLTNIKIPDSVTIIGEAAFQDCYDLTNIKIPESVTIIGYSAFWYCSSLTSIEIPGSVTSIGDGAFCRCDNLTVISVDASNQYYSSQNGILYNKDKTKLICCPGGKSGSVVIPSTVTSIGYGAFMHCQNLTGITIPGNVTYIGESAFWNCTGLTSLNIPGSVTSIDEAAFYGCNSLTSIKIPDSVTRIGDGAFECCENLTSIEISDSVTSIGDYVFALCYDLTNIKIPSSVTSIGYCAFDGCSNLQNVYYEGTAEQWDRIDISSGNDELISGANIFCNSRVITYDANGGSGAPARQIKIYGKALTLSTTKPTRTGYTFVGWATSKTATSATYTAGGSYTKNASVTLYAVWKAKTYTVKYYANGGTGAPASGTKTYGKSYTISSTKPTRSGYTFIGWATTKSATTAKYKPGKSYSTLSSFTLYAVWIKGEAYEVTYNANGGSGAPGSAYKVKNQSFTISSTKPTRYGYTFVGWATSKTATTAKYYAGKSYTRLDSFNLYAVWKAKTYTVKYYANGGTGAPASGTKTYGKSFTISSTKPTRSGYQFLGWATSKTATTAKYKAGYSYSSLDSFTLYAVWAKKNTVTYDANGGSGAPANGVKVTNQAFTISTTKPTRSGYTFLGWATTKSATTAKYLPGKTYSTLGSFTLYAVWQKK